MTLPENRQSLLALLGLARRAGKLLLGARAVEMAVQKGRRPLLILARDIGPTQGRHLMGLSPIRGVLTDAVDRTELARALGRRKLSAVGVYDPGFLAGIAKLGYSSQPSEPDKQKHEKKR